MGSARLVTWNHSTRETRARDSFDDVASTMHQAKGARRVIGYRLTKEMRARNAFGDVASNIHQPPPPGWTGSRRRRTPPPAAASPAPELGSPAISPSNHVSVLPFHPIPTSAWCLHTQHPLQRGAILPNTHRHRPHQMTHDDKMRRGGTRVPRTAQRQHEMRWTHYDARFGCGRRRTDVVR